MEGNFTRFTEVGGILFELMKPGLGLFGYEMQNSSCISTPSMTLMSKMKEKPVYHCGLVSKFLAAVYCCELCSKVGISHRQEMMRLESVGNFRFVPRVFLSDFNESSERSLCVLRHKRVLRTSMDGTDKLSVRLSMNKQTNQIKFISV